VVLAFFGGLEALCRLGIIDAFTMPAPSRIALDLWRLLAKGALDATIAKTMTNAAIGFLLAVAVGIAAAVVIHRLGILREALDPLFATYYAIPVFAFYPLLIILLGLIPYTLYSGVLLYRKAVSWTGGEAGPLVYATARVIACAILIYALWHLRKTGSRLRKDNSTRR